METKLYRVNDTPPANMDWAEVLSEYAVLRSMTRDGLRKWSHTYMARLEQRENTLIRFIAERTAEREKHNV